jgi:short-subunit dehydrogenase
VRAVRRRRPIAGRVIAVTGGTRGIGAAIGADLRRRGAQVVAGDLDPGEGALRLNVADRDSFAAFLDHVRSEHGRVDVLVNNAGVMHVGPFISEEDSWTRRQIDVNFYGVALGMKLVLPEMLARGDGHVVNVASMAARLGARFEATYTGTKHAVYGLSDAVRQEVRGQGVALSVVMPGLVRTDLAAGTTEAAGIKVLTPEDVAAAVADALERPRFDVYVPREYAVLDRLTSPLPRPLRERVLRLAGSERHTASTTADARAAYEERIAALDG